MHEWLNGARDRLAAESGAEARGLDLSQEDIDRLLELASVAAHESGDRKNAPIACYLAGLARGRTGSELEALVRAATGKG
jgi:hypothetical protein